MRGSCEHNPLEAAPRGPKAIGKTCTLHTLSSDQTPLWDIPSLTCCTVRKPWLTHLSHTPVRYKSLTCSRCSVKTVEGRNAWRGREGKTPHSRFSSSLTLTSKLTSRITTQAHSDVQPRSPAQPHSHFRSPRDTALPISSLMDHIPSVSSHHSLWSSTYCWP